MRYTILLTAAAAITNVYAITFAEMSSAPIDFLKKARDAIPALAERKAAACPAVWTNVVSDLTAMFLDNTVSPSQCNDNARAAIRAAFHDCGTWDKTQGATGGCDGSLILADEVSLRGENNGLQDIAGKMIALRAKYNNQYSMADLLQVAASVAIVTCPGGPRVTTYVGRVDNANPAGNPHNNLPDVHASAASLYTLFQNKGFDDVDLAALLGAHSTSKNIGQTDIPVGAPQDSTPGLWDVKYYSDTTHPPTGCVPFASDVSLAAHPVVGKQFAGFVNNQGKWTGKFASAMLKLSLLGVPGGSSNLIDCTNIIPKGTNNKRDMKAFPIFAARN